MNCARMGLVASCLLVVATSISGCGYSEDQWKAKQLELDKMTAKLRATEKQRDDDKAQCADERKKLEEAKEHLETLLKNAGGEVSELRKLADQQKLRIAQYEAVQRRFRALQDRLQQLKGRGVEVVARKGRLVIRLPGDVLFDSASHMLRPGAAEVLAKIAEVIRNEPTLLSRYFQVVGHTDNAELVGGVWGNNWGLSLARAKTVLEFLVRQVGTGYGGKPMGGGLPPERWSAGGYGKEDPIEGTVESQTVPQMAKNRRVELVIQPNVEELLNSLDTL